MAVPVCSFISSLLEKRNRPQVAKAVGITNVYLGQIMKGTIPSREVLIKLAWELGISARIFLELAGMPCTGGLLIIRGLPGSGKTTLAKKIIRTMSQDAVHLEADMFFEDEDGNYNFDPNLLGDAHAWCEAKAIEAMRKDQNVIVSNTFTQVWEFEPYLRAATNIGVPCEVIVATGNYQNTHGVSEEKLQAMKDRWEDLAHE